MVSICATNKILGPVESLLGADESLYIAVSVVFEMVLQRSVEDLVKGTKEHMNNILCACNIQSTCATKQRVTRVLEKMKGKPDNYKWATNWLLSTKYNPNPQSGWPPVISVDYKAIVSLVFEFLLDHMSITATTNFICKAQKRKGLGWMSHPAIYGLVWQLDGKQVATKMQQQGSKNLTSNWALARWGQYLHIMIQARANIFDSPEEAQE